MTFLHILFFKLIDPVIIILGVMTGLYFLSLKLRVIFALTIALLVQLIFVMQYEGQVITPFSLIIGSVAAFIWMVIGARLKALFLNIRDKNNKLF